MTVRQYARGIQAPNCIIKIELLVPRTSIRKIPQRLGSMSCRGRKEGVQDISFRLISLRRASTLLLDFVYSDQCRNKNSLIIMKLKVSCVSKHSKLSTALKGLSPESGLNWEDPLYYSLTRYLCLTKTQAARKYTPIHVTRTSVALSRRFLTYLKLEVIKETLLSH